MNTTRRMSSGRLKALTVFVAFWTLMPSTSTSLLRAAQDDHAATDQKLADRARELGHSGELSNTHELIELLKNPSQPVRVAAAENLGELLADHGYLGHDATSPGENLSEIVEGVAQRAKQATLLPLRALEVAGFREALIKAVNDSSSPVRAAAVHALERIFASDNPKRPPPDVKQAIAPHIADADPAVILAAMRAAFFLHMDESRPTIIANLRHENTGVRADAAQTLALMGASEAALPISRLLKDQEPDVRKSAARQLLWLCNSSPCDRAIGPALLAALPEKELRSDVARTIVVTKIPEGRQPLASALQEDADWGLSDFTDIDTKKMVDFLGLDVTKEIEMLGHQLSKGTPPVQASSATHLGSLHDRRAAPLLFEALKSTDSDVLSAVIRAVPEVTPEIGDKSALKRVQEIASLPDPPLVETVQQQVPKLKDRAMFGIALTILRNRTLTTEGVCSLLPRVCRGRWEFASHPNLFESREVLDTKLDWLKSGDSGVRMTISSALVLAGAPEALHPVALSLKDADVKIRANSAEALFWMCVDGLCDDSIVPSLLAALGNKETRGNAARTLAYLNRRETVEAVFSALQQDSAEDGMGLTEYWEADVENLMNFLGKDNLQHLLRLYRATGPAAARRQAERFLAEIASARESGCESHTNARSVRGCFSLSSKRRPAWIPVATKP